MSGAFSAADYLDRARIGFAHLQQHNREYLDDGQENILDDYCALLAATELYAAGGRRPSTARPPPSGPSGWRAGWPTAMATAATGGPTAAR